MVTVVDAAARAASGVDSVTAVQAAADGNAMNADATQVWGHLILHQTYHFDNPRAPSLTERLQPVVW